MNTPESTLKHQLQQVVENTIECGALYADFIRQTKIEFITSVLLRHRGNQCRSAKELVMHRNTLSRTIEELKIDMAAIRIDTLRDAAMIANAAIALNGTSLK